MFTVFKGLNSSKNVLQYGIICPEDGIENE